MQVGINASDLDHELTLTLAARAERVGLDAVWLGETWGWEAFTLLGELAQVTNEVTLGTGIVPVYSRSPALLGQAAATAARASDGRFVLGVGASGPTVIENWHGVKFDRPVGRTAETVSVIKQVLSGEVVDHDGRDFELSGFRLRVEPPNDVPVYVGALGETNVRMAGAEADGWMPIFVPERRLRELREEFHESARRHDRDPAELAIVPNTVAAVSEDGEAAREQVRQHIAFYVGTMGSFYHRMLSEAGFEDDADAIRSLWQEEGPESAAERVPREVVDTAAIAGTPDEAAERLDAYEELGAKGVSLFFPRRAEPALMRETVDHLGRLADR
ncbi:MAG: LLM class flavin-dependent oxidoreductase [Halolamina sp.]